MHHSNSVTTSKRTKKIKKMVLDTYYNDAVIEREKSFGKRKTT